jgi:Holliday junction DNA helicase RuvA
MIAWLSGKVVDTSMLNTIVLDVNGVGYAVETTSVSYALLSTEKQVVNLFIHTNVREDAINLYGFLEQEERSLFRSLIKVNGIGPKSAMAILSAMSPGMFIQCIQLQDKTMLTKLPGVGKKTAERMLIELQDILKDTFTTTLPMATTANLSVGEAISALEALGYRYHDAQEAVKKIKTDDMDSQGLIKAALKILAKC